MQPSPRPLPPSNASAYAKLSSASSEGFRERRPLKEALVGKSRSRIERRASGPCGPPSNLLSAKTVRPWGALSVSLPACSPLCGRDGAQSLHVARESLG